MDKIKSEKSAVDVKKLETAKSKEMKPTVSNIMSSSAIRKSVTINVPTTETNVGSVAGKSGKSSKSKSKISFAKSATSSSDSSHDSVRTEGDCRLNHILVVHHDILCCKCSNDGRLVAIGMLNGAIRVYDPPVVNCLYVLASQDVIKGATPVTALSFQPSLKIGALKTHILASSYSSGFVKLWNIENKECLYTIEEDRQTLTVAFSRDGLFLASSGYDGRISVYDVETRDLIMILEAGESVHTATGHKSRVFSVVYHPLDFHNLLSGGWDAVVHIWDDRQKYSVRSIFGPHICGEGIDLVAEENLVMTAAWHKHHPLQLWHFESCELIKNVVPDTTPCLFLRKNYMITGGSNVNMVRVIDRLSYTTIATLKDLPNAVVGLTHNPYFVYPKVICISGEKLYVIDVKLSTPVTEEKHVNRNLSLTSVF